MFGIPAPTLFVNYFISYRFMFWTDLDSQIPRVEVARMDGSGRMALQDVNRDNIKQPSNVAVDPLTRYVYWADVFDGNEKIVRYVCLDTNCSSGQEHLLSLSGNALVHVHVSTVQGHHVKSS